MKKVVCYTITILFTLFVFAGLLGQSPVWAEEKILEIKPYGFILLNAQYNDNLPADIPFKVALSDTFSNFLITARQTRFGFKMSYEATWKIAGQIELDFWGLKGSGANGASMQSAPRLRLANFKINKENLTFLFGQDWTVFAPLSPTSWAHVSIPALSSCGNLWNRFPQIRGEYKTKVGENNSLLLQGAVLRPLGADVAPAATQAEQMGAGEFNGLPFVQARAAFGVGKTATIGVSTHFGQEDFSKYLDKKIGPANDTLVNKIDEKTVTQAVAGDLSVKINWVSISGEGFFGKNLSMLFSNAYLWFSEYEYDTTTDHKKTLLKKGEPVEALGGWGQISLSPPKTKVSFNIGGGIEILKEEQVDTLIFDPFFSNRLKKNTPQLWKNMTIFANVILTPIEKVTFALEVNNITTTYKVHEGGAIKEKDAKDNCVNLACKFDF